MSKSNIIRVSSQKGGVGKTVTAVNLAVAVRLFGYKVLLVDADLSNPAVGFYLGLEDVNVGTYEVMNGRVGIAKAIITHEPSGLDVIPAVLSGKIITPSAENIRRLGQQLSQINYDFVFIDTAPGFFLPEIAKHYTEALILTSPEMSACVSSIRLAHTYDKYGLKHRLALNRVRNKRYEMSPAEVEEAYGDSIYAIIPEDEIVPRSIAEHIPAYILDKRSPFSKAMSGLAKKYASRLSPQYSEEINIDGGGIIGFLKRLFGFK